MDQGQTDRRRHGGRPTYVGRVGALALFLGVGAVITPVPVMAAADPGSSESTASVNASDASARPTPARQSRGARTDGPVNGSEGTRRSKSPAAAASVDIAHQARNKAAAVTAPTASVSGPETPAIEHAVESPTASELSVPSASVSDSSAPSSAAPTVQVAAPVALSAAAAPVMTVATPRGAVSALAGDPLAWLGGGSDPLAPIAAPFGWAALAVSRRDFARAAAAAVPAASVSVSEPASSPLTDALAAPGATTALVAAAKQFVLTVAGGGNSATALQTGIRSLENNPLFSSITWSGLISDPALPQVAGSSVASVVSQLAADPEVRAAVGEALSGYLGSALGGLPASIAPSLTNAAVALLADPAAGAALGSVAGSAVTAFLSQPGVVSGLAGVPQNLQEALNGQGFGSALDNAWESLQAVSAIRDGVVVAVTTGVTTALSDPGLVGALGTAATSLVNDLSADPSTWKLVGDLLGPTYGDPIVSLLSDTVSAGNLANTVGTVVTGFLGQTGVVAALSGAAGQLTTALLSGTSTIDALNTVFDSLQTDPAILAAVDATASVALHSILGDSAVQDAVGAVAEKVVANLINGSTDTSNLSPVVGQLLSSAVDSLLANDAVQSLITAIAPALVGGASISDLTDTVIQAVIGQPDLQVAVGTAVGTAVGALIGNNAIGDLVGRVVGRSVTRLIKVAIKIAPLLGKLGFKLPGAAAADNRLGSTYLFAVGAV